MPWIPHPALDHPVSWYRWLKYHFGDWLQNVGSALSHSAINPDWKDDDLPF